ncbi:hypothetical protein H312_01941 [Anncaliia algerae PRA339]|uniref:Uncharacterized protein n=1 Tax=Anncaliia algerae PRA339 TaxID=1288291 RepID=A0A059F0Y7_9MICR|nr:hypothetical protein H312_01941 [Anncaliia algerae PRA339]
MFILSLKMLLWPQILHLFLFYYIIALFFLAWPYYDIFSHILFKPYFDIFLYLISMNYIILYEAKYLNWLHAHRLLCFSYKYDLPNLHIRILSKPYKDLIYGFTRSILFMCSTISSKKY